MRQATVPTEGEDEPDQAKDQKQERSFDRQDDGGDHQGRNGQPGEQGNEEIHVLGCYAARLSDQARTRFMF